MSTFAKGSPYWQNNRCRGCRKYYEGKERLRCPDCGALLRRGPASNQWRDCHR